METTLLIVIGLIIAGGITYLILRGQKTDGLEMLNQNVSENLKLMMSQMNETRRSVDERLKENALVLQKNNESMGSRLDNAAKVIGNVQKELGKLAETTNTMIDIGKDISSLQDILKAPKLRGGMGELFLENLLAQVFIEKSSYSLQYTFRSGEKVDAAIHLREGMMVSIDSKFPLENFKKMMEAQNEKDEKKATSFKKLFYTDVKKHIDDIAKKYILPEEGTLEFALMYIPAENVYYEIATKDMDNENNLAQYALSKKVIPVSPNTFFIYLQTLLIGLRGLQLEKNTKEVLARLSHLQTDFGKFAEEYELVGTHLLHAKSSYEKSEKRLGNFQEKLVGLEGGREHKALIEEKALKKAETMTE